MKISVFISLLFLLPGIAFSQGKEDKELSRSIAFGLFVHSYGTGLEVQASKFKNKNYLTAGFTLSSYKSRKELKIESAYKDQGGKDYIFDKVNFAYVLAPTIGVGREWISKSDNNRISVRSTFSLGPAFAFLKPYYLEIARPINNTQAVVEVAPYDASQHTFTNIVGEADFFLGMNEITVTPGIRAKFNSQLDFSGGAEYIRAIELGLFADVFFKDLEILDIGSDRRAFIGGSIALLIGNAW